MRALPARARIALTGTPVENSLGDLWSLFNFLNPGLLGSQQVFRNYTSRLAQEETNRYAALRNLVAPYILRRLKTDRRIVPDLPDKTETTRFCGLSRTQVRMYARIVEDMERALETVESIQRLGLVLGTLMRLKQVCNHPDQVSGASNRNVSDSGKFQRLQEICQELAERQERVLVFTQFREIIDPIAALLAQTFRRNGLILHGGTSIASRPKLVESFQDAAGPPFMVISLRAGGTGLNLTAASHVIHFDRWWKPCGREPGHGQGLPDRSKTQCSGAQVRHDGHDRRTRRRNDRGQAANWLTRS